MDDFYDCLMVLFGDCHLVVTFIVQETSVIIISNLLLCCTDERTSFGNEMKGSTFSFSADYFGEMLVFKSPRCWGKLWVVEAFWSLSSAPSFDQFQAVMFAVSHQLCSCRLASGAYEANRRCVHHRHFPCFTEGQLRCSHFCREIREVPSQPHQVS